MRLQLNDSTIIIRKESKFCFMTERHKISISVTEDTEDLVNSLLNEKCLDTDNLVNDQLVNVCNILHTKRMLVKEMFFDDSIDKCNLKYMHYYVDNPYENLNRIRNVNVCIVGMGGVGQVVLQHLVASGFRRFSVIDYDVVNLNNFNRQFLANRNQLSIPKIQAIKNNVELTWKDVQIETFCAKICESNDLMQLIKIHKMNPDIIVCAADYPKENKIKKIILSTALQIDTPCCFSSIGIGIGEIGPLLVGTKSIENYINILDDINIAAKKEYTSVISGSVGYTNTIASTYLAFDIYKYFTNTGIVNSLNRRLLYDFDNMKIISELKI